MVLGLQVAAPGASGRPGALDENGLEPRCASLYPIGASLACAFVVAGIEASPGNEMTGVFEAAHIDADLGDDHPAESEMKSRRAFSISMATQRFDVAVDLLMDAGDGRAVGIDVIQMQLQHKAMMSRHPAAQRGFQLRRGGRELTHPPVRLVPGCSLAGDQGLEDAAARETQNICDH